MLDEMNSLRQALIFQRGQARDRADAVLRRAKNAGQDLLTDSENVEFRRYVSDVEKLGAVVHALDALTETLVALDEEAP